MSDKIDEVQPGGKYVGVDGRYHDANGNDLGPVDPLQKETETEKDVKKTARNRNSE